MALVGAAPTLTSSIRDERITRGNGNGIAWNAREKPQDAASTETGKLQGDGVEITSNKVSKKETIIIMLFNHFIEIVIAWIENVADHVIASEGPEADRAIVSADEVATDCRILISKRSNVPVTGETGETAIAIAIGIARDGAREATIAIAIEIVSGISGTEIAIVGTERIVAIVRMRIRKRSELRKNLWTVSV